jgi:hypothetical protein
MSCCDNTSCIQVYINDDTSSVDTGLIATQTGQWKIMVEFNGGWQRKLLNFNLNDHIVIPNIFNSNYKHTVQIFTPAGVLFNDTCYIFDMCNVIDAVSSTATIIKTTDISYLVTASPVNTGDGSYGNPYQVPAGNTVTLTQLIGYAIHSPVTVNGGLVQVPSWNSTSGVLDNTANGGFNVGDLITISYEKTL